MTIDDKILLAAGDLRQDTFTAEELIVAAFKRFPADFSLMGFPEYPDSNRVLTQITTAGRGLQRRGWLLRVAAKRYQLTDEGRRHLDAIRFKTEARSVRTQDRDIADLLQHWLGSEALRQFRRGAKDEIAERQALGYWRLTSGSTAAKTHRMLAVAESATALLVANIQQRVPTQIHHLGLVPVDDAEKLIDLHRYLRKRFADALGYLQSQRR